MSATIRVIYCGLIVLGWPFCAHAWGTRGHAVVTEVGVRLTALRLGQDATRWSPFRQRAWMLGYVSNIPDTYWRGLPKDVSSLLNPTHYINLEYFGVQKFSDVKTIQLSEANTLAIRSCLESGLGQKLTCADNPKEASKLEMRRIFQETGSAPWRVAQLHEQLVNSLKAAGEHTAGRKKKMVKKATNAVNDALVLSGILSHFVADLAQPQHTTRDYDSFEAKQGGLHAYFETLVVDEMALSLAQDVYNRSVQLNRAQFTQVHEIKGSEALDWAFLLAADSFSEIPRLIRIDRDASLLKPSVEKEGLRIPAQRRDAAGPDVQAAYRDLVVERLAKGAFVLSELYKRAWESANRPDLSSYQSFFFAHQPEPDIPSYLR